MNSNYNDIIDIILTLTKDEEIAKSIAVSGSIVPYIVAGKESKEYHSDFYILVKERKTNIVRNKLKLLSKEFMFDIISDSKKYSKYDYGFKIKYENTTVGFFPYSLIDNTLTIKTFSIDNKHKKINLKKKIIPKVSKSDVIRLTSFDDDRILRIMSPEFILADKEIREKQPGNPTIETMYLLDEICDRSLLKKVREEVNNTKVMVVSKNINEDKIIIILSLILLFIIMLIIIFLKVKK